MPTLLRRVAARPSYLLSLVGLLLLTASCATVNYDEGRLFRPGDCAS